MMESLHSALSRPDEVIESYSVDHDFASFFRNLFSNQMALDQIPLISHTSSPSSLPSARSLVRFRAMIQDTGYGNELYQALSSTGQSLMYGIPAHPDTHDSSDQSTQDYAHLKERQSFYIISVPGETPWYKRSLDSQSQYMNLQSSIASLSLSPSNTPQVAHSLTPISDPKYPVASETHFGCMAKIYGSAADTIRPSDVLDFIGIMGEAPASDPFKDLVDDSTTIQELVPTLHVIFMLPIATKPTVANAEECLRGELIEYLSTGLGGDVEAAEWVLLAMLARIHTRHPTGIALGNLSLNLALPPGFSVQLSPILSNLLPRVVDLELTIPYLNDVNTKLAPRNRNESLESGSLQLASGTMVVVDMCSIGEGKLLDAGVRNLQHLTTTIANQKLTYEFPYSSFELDVDLGFILLSEGKAFVATTCTVPVQPATRGSVSSPISESKLDAFRAFLFKMKHSDFNIPTSMSEIIQNDFVLRRQKREGGSEGMTQEDLLFRMTAARLMALSLSRAELDEEVWTRTAELDEKRKGRLVPRSGSA